MKSKEIIKEYAPTMDTPDFKGATTRWLANKMAGVPADTKTTTSEFNQIIQANDQQQSSFVKQYDSRHLERFATNMLKHIRSNPQLFQKIISAASK